MYDLYEFYTKGAGDAAFDGVVVSSGAHLALRRLKESVRFPAGRTAAQIADFVRQEADREHTIRQGKDNHVSLAIRSFRIDNIAEISTEIASMICGADFADTSGLLARCLLEAMRNAVTHGAAGREGFSGTLFVIRTQSFVSVSIEDEGCGLAATISDLFEDVRARKVDVRARKGTFVRDAGKLDQREDFLESPARTALRLLTPYGGSSSAARGERDGGANRGTGLPVLRHTSVAFTIQSGTAGLFYRRPRADGGPPYYQKVLSSRKSLCLFDVPPDRQHQGVRIEFVVNLKKLPELLETVDRHLRLLDDPMVRRVRDRYGDAIARRVGLPAPQTLTW